jgi:hypothetical protein
MYARDPYAWPGMAFPEHAPGLVFLSLLAGAPFFCYFKLTERTLASYFQEKVNEVAAAAPPPYAGFGFGVLPSHNGKQQCFEDVCIHPPPPFFPLCLT